MTSRCVVFVLLCPFSAVFGAEGITVQIDAGQDTTEGTPARDAADGIEFFEARVRPVLIQHCYKCHAAEADEIQGGLRVDTRDALRKGGDSGPAVVEGDAGESLLVRALRHDGVEMPPDRKLPADVIGDFARWVQMGAPDPRDAESATEPAAATDIDWQQARLFWSFQRPRPQARPAVRQSDWPSRRIDYFVLRRLEEAGLEPSPRANAPVLVRRLAFDLTGLPPRPADMDRITRDTSPRQIDQWVDRWISSPQFGERWARMWLDLARFAEDQAHIVGSNKSLFYPNAFRYRDWVIDAFNQDLPYDQFVRAQLAADLVSPADASAQVALGFLGLGPKYYDRGRLAVKAEEWEDRVDTVTRGLLGLTLACARCHDHKYDPFPTEDYYALAGIFASSEMFNRPFDAHEPSGKLKQSKNPAEAIHVIREAKPTDLNVFVRGNVDSPGDLVPRGYVQILAEGDRRQFRVGSGRKELADAIANRSNPLTARVFVNRVWGELFGKPLVNTTSNFGVRGDRPTHPALLDDLAVRFMDNGWSLKWLVREIVTSSTYQQSSVASEEHLLADPENALLGSMNRRRLSVEAWRDSLLASADRLDGRIGGPSMDPQQPQGRRRTIYASVSRFQLNPMLALFDFPDANVHSAARAETITPIQKLFTMNHPLMVQQAEFLVARVLHQRDRNLNERVESLYMTLFSRSPASEELRLARRFLEAEKPDGRAAWMEYTQALLTTNEMLFLD